MSLHAMTLAGLAIAAIVLGASGAAEAQTSAYRTFQPPGTGPYPAVVFAS